MNTALDKFKVYASIFIIILGLIETLLFFSLENIVATVSLITGWFFLISLTLTNHNLNNYPVSFIMLLGMSLFYYLLPLPLTILELKPITFNMRVPDLTMLHHAAFAIVIALTHKIYTILSNNKNVFRSFLKKTNFYVEPTNKLIWITSLTGFAGAFVNYFILGIWQMDNQDRTLMYHINTIMSSYIWMPIIILFPKYRTNFSLQTKKNTIVFIVIYTTFLILIAITSNWRTILYSGIFLFIGLFSLSLLLNHFSIKSIFTPKRLILTILAVILITGPLMRMTLAMTIVRAERTDLNAVEFLNKTIDVFFDDDQINLAKSESFNTNNSTIFDAYEWNENYLNSPLLNRISSLKISDNSMFYADKIGYQNKDMQDETINQIYAFTPNIFLSLINYDLDTKTETAKYSIGDYLYSLAINSNRELGSALISSMPGVGMAIFGYWYLVIIIPLFIMIFTMFDSFVDIKNGRIIFSYLFFLMFITTLNYFNDRHVFIFEIRFILRTYFETIIVYLLTMKIFNFFISR